MTQPNATIQTPPDGAAPVAPAEPSMEELASTLFKPDPDAPTDDGAAPEAKKPDAPVAKTETKDEQAAPVQAERVAKRIEVATRAELRAAEQRRELVTLQQQLETRTKDLDARETKLRLLEEDPVRAFEELKLDPKSFLEKLAGEQQPENVIAKRLAVVEDQLKKERETRAQLEQETKRQQQAAEVDADWKAASAAFIDHVGASAEKFPHLVAEYTEQEAIEKAYSVLAEPVTVEGRDGKPITISRAEAYRAQFGDYPDNDVIAEHLDKLAKADFEARQNSAWRKRNGDQNAMPGQGSKPGDKEEARTVRGSNPRTLTSRDASERGTAPKPWTQEAADEESERIIAEALRRNR